MGEARAGGKISAPQMESNSNREIRKTKSLRAWGFKLCDQHTAPHGGSTTPDAPGLGGEARTEKRQVATSDRKRRVM